MLQYEEEGYLPDALLNYLVRLGWSHGDQEVFTREEMIAAFDIHDVNKAASAFNPEKLLWLNQQHMMRAEPSSLIPHLRAQLRRLGVDSQDEKLLEGVILAQRERAKTFKEMAQNSSFFCIERVEIDAKAAAKHLSGGRSAGAGQSANPARCQHHFERSRATSPRSRWMQSSTQRTSHFWVVAGSTALSIARPARSCCTSAGDWGVATPEMRS